MVIKVYQVTGSDHLITLILDNYFLPLSGNAPVSRYSRMP